ncbi:MAG TPA: zinc-binding alcohol dehydrogenase family protein [Ktedonobacterales bacterium]|nr:zinc-binding alcohol dehydrogenase family protein [Ktedonobacterales bacterium]
MKAAVLHKFGKAPRYEDFPDPTRGEGEVFVEVKAVALENIDRAMARGSHFASRQSLPHLPAIVGSDGIGALENGQLIGFGGMKPPYGAMAERVVIPDLHYVQIPDGVDAAIAATVPSSALTALFPLKWGAQLQADETVLINGATGFAGKLAVQVARLVGAKRIVATGRNDEALRSLADLGADSVIDLKQSDAQLAAAFKREAGGAGYGVILDFLWGHPTEILIATLVPDTLSFAKGRTRLVQIGEMAGPRITLSADALRTSGLTILGGGSGITPEALAEGASQVWDWIKEGRLKACIECVPLKDVERAWKRTDVQGRRIVMIP